MEFNIIPLFPSSVVMVNVEEDTSELDEARDIPLASSANDPSAGSSGNIGDPYYWGTGSNVRVLERYPKTKKILLDKFASVAEEALGFKKREWAITTSWLTTSHRGEGSSLHCHKNAFWSCVYYYQQEYPEGSGGILFDNPNTVAMDFYFQNSDLKHINPTNSLACTFRPEPNLMLCFPSYLQHQVLTHNNDKPRKSLAFNVVPVGPYGEHDSSYDPSWVVPYAGSWKSK